MYHTVMFKCSQEPQMDFTVGLFKDPNKIYTFNFVNIYLKSLLIYRYLTSLFFSPCKKSFKDSIPLVLLSFSEP